MDPLVHTRDQGTIETVNITRRTCSEEGEDCPFGRKGYDHRFFGIHIEDVNCSTSTTWRRAKRSQGTTMPNYWADLTANCRKDRPHSAKKKMLFHHDNHGTGSHLRRRHRQISRIRLRTAASSTVFSRFDPMRLLSVSKLEKVTHWAEIRVE